MLQPPLGQFATGVPRVDVSIEFIVPEIEDGTLLLSKNHTLHDESGSQFSFEKTKERRAYEIPVSAYSVTHTPPPAALNA